MKDKRPCIRTRTDRFACSRAYLTSNLLTEATATTAAAVAATAIATTIAAANISSPYDDK